MESVEPLVRLITKIQEELPDFPTLFSSSKEIQVRVGSLEGSVSCTRTMILYGNSAEEPKNDTSLFCLDQYPFRFVRYCGLHESVASYTYARKGPGSYLNFV